MKYIIISLLALFIINLVLHGSPEFQNLLILGLFLVASLGASYG